MLIGIAGKIGSGKDTVAKLINHIIAPKVQQEGMLIPPEPWELVQQGLDAIYVPFRIVKYADKIKDMTCVLLGCTRKQLEDPIWKEQPLGKQWIKYRLDTEVFTNTFGDVKNSLYFTDREEANKEMVRFMKKARFEKAVLKHINVTPEQMTPRKVMQLMGTDFGRDMIHPDVWVLSTFQRWSEHNNWIITDVRFQNEVDAILKRGGFLIHVDRGDSSSDTHTSETELDDFYEYDFHISNRHTLKELQEQVEVICLELELI